MKEQGRGIRGRGEIWANETKGRRGKEGESMGEGLVWRATCGGIGEPRYLERAVLSSLSFSNRLGLAPGVVPSASSLGSSRASGCC